MFSKPKEKSNKGSPAAEKEPAAVPEPAPAQPDEATSQDDAGATGESAQTPPPSAAEAAPSFTEAQELAVMKDRYTRLMADFDNFRKRQLREREEWLKRANEELLGDLLPVVDHLELALNKTAAPNDPFVTGVKLVYDQFIALLTRYGLTPVDAKGKPFDPAFHEALSQMTSATVPANEVIDQFRRGWCLAGRLLRPAQVIVSSGLPDEAQAAAEDASVSD